MYMDTVDPKTEQKAQMALRLVNDLYVVHSTGEENGGRTLALRFEAQGFASPRKTGAPLKAARVILRSEPASSSAHRELSFVCQTLGQTRRPASRRSIITKANAALLPTEKRRSLRATSPFLMCALLKFASNNCRPSPAFGRARDFKKGWN
jgi:hypothetical protein